MAKQNGETAYLPESISVIYPMKIDGKSVADSGGNKYGLRVNANLRYKQVDGLWGLTSQNYESSDYETETNVDRILKIAAKGGMNQVGNPDAANVPEIELGTPETGLAIYYQYNNGANTELYVPALIFPVTKIPENTYFYGSRVIVPLTKELLSQYEDGNQPIPTPLRESAIK